MLDDGDLPEVLQEIGRSLLEQVLLALAFADRADRRYHVVRKTEIVENGRRERTHSSQNGRSGLS